MNANFISLTDGNDMILRSRALRSCNWFTSARRLDWALLWVQEDGLALR
jgi:hypothetical protein